MSERPTVVVVGAGITGLAAAWQLVRAPDPPTVVVLEADDRLGGKIRTEEPFAGHGPIELGPDAFLARVPPAVELCQELELASELVSPATGSAWLWWRNRLRRLPGGLVLGVPSDLPAVARSGIVGPLGLARAALDLVLPESSSGDEASADRSVGDVVTARFGRQVQTRLVDPLLGGINAGRSELLSARATAPQLDAAARAGRSLLLGLRRQATSSASAAGPVFLTHPRGLGHVVATLADALVGAGADIRTGAPARALSRDPRGWVVATDGGDVRADGVIVCTPAPAAARLLSVSAPDAAAGLASIEHASVAVATYSFGRDAMSTPFDGSGLLVPRPDGRLMTAATFMSSKWAHVADSSGERIVVRVSAGRHRDERAARLRDDELLHALAEELAQATGISGPPLESTLTRWPAAFPQYTVGHLDRVASIESALERVPGVAVAGAAMRGVGIPACIAQGRQAADRALARLRAGRAA